MQSNINKHILVNHMEQLVNACKIYTKTLKELPKYSTSTWSDFHTNLFQDFIRSLNQENSDKHSSSTVLIDSPKFIYLDPSKWDTMSSDKIMAQYNDVKIRFENSYKVNLPDDVDEKFIKYLNIVCVQIGEVILPNIMVNDNR